MLKVKHFLSPSILCVQHWELQLNFTEIQLYKVLITCTKGQISVLCSDINLVKQSSVSGYKIISLLGYKSKAKRDCKLESDFDSLPRKKSGAKAHSWLASQSLTSLVYISCPLQLKAKSLNQISFHFLRIIRVHKSCCEDQQYVSYKSCLIVNSVESESRHS